MLNWTVRTPSGDLRGDEKKLYVKARQVLWDYEPLRASHAQIEIGVQGRTVVLSGRVRTVVQKQLADLFVTRMPEVDSVVNQLVADPEVIRSVADALAGDERTAPYTIQIQAAHGVVTLSGEVPDDTTRRAALNTSFEVVTVAAVRDKMTVGGSTFPSEAVSRSAVAV